MQCFWLPVRECPYLESSVDITSTNPLPVVEKKDNPMLEHFCVEEVCRNCMIATYIQMKGRV